MKRCSLHNIRIYNIQSWHVCIQHPYIYCIPIDVHAIHMQCQPQKPFAGGKLGTPCLASMLEKPLRRRAEWWGGDDTILYIVELHAPKLYIESQNALRLPQIHPALYRAAFENTTTAYTNIYWCCLFIYPHFMQVCKITSSNWIVICLHFVMIAVHCVKSERCPPRASEQWHLKDTAGRTGTTTGTHIYMHI